ncbi:hypothetical protein [Enterobacter hormaechei]|uniref:hypothetical protein n=1 Tax=Enterobacter hormaechei TaxID=158836 RepID=UPI00211597A6|nr:hypothetical protein [Enterobacter hormaechei]
MSNIDKHIDKQALRDQSVEGSFYLVECCNCGEMYPSNLLDGGEAIADSGDYGDCYCHLCGADDTERADWGDVNSNEAKAWNFQQKRIEALLDELEAKDSTIATQQQEIRTLLNALGQSSEKRNSDLPDQKRIIGWRASDYTDETSDPELAKNWAAAIGMLPIFEGDVNTKLSAAAAGKGEAS